MRVNRGKTVLSKIVERTGPKSKNNGFSDKKKNPANPLVYWIFRWRRRWDSNPRYREVQLISSQSRYDHFDTSPNTIYIIYVKRSVVNHKIHFLLTLIFKYSIITVDGKIGIGCFFTTKKFPTELFGHNGIKSRQPYRKFCEEITNWRYH